MQVDKLTQANKKMDAQLQILGRKESGLSQQLENSKHENERLRIEVKRACETKVGLAPSAHSRPNLPAPRSLFNILAKELFVFWHAYSRILPAERSCMQMHATKHGHAAARPSFWKRSWRT